ncbi:MAG: hypothetical protein LQ342_001230 [Letrouitia transgressa]|nr:MAG: hypothetical protein LQ342_001230 [Letrouitia transgressa]
MASSRFESEQFFSESFVESVGAILFRLSTREICTVHLYDRNEYVLAKGRRNCGETRQSAAMREIAEETGLRCSILPIKMVTRNPPAVEAQHVPDEPRLHIDACEPFALQLRCLAEDNVKLIWWYIAAVEEGEGFQAGTQEQDKFGVKFHDFASAVQKLTFQMDRDMVKKAIETVEGTYGAVHVSTDTQVSYDS